jgi:hypothetical protein
MKQFRELVQAPRTGEGFDVPDGSLAHLALISSGNQNSIEGTRTSLKGKREPFHVEGSKYRSRFYLRQPFFW